MISRIIMPFSEPEVSLDTVGGKGLSLSRMVAVGLPVPDGFHVTTAAYQQFVAENHLQEKIMAALEHAEPYRPSMLETVSNEIEKMFLSGTLPQSIADAIAKAYTGLGENIAVAVRSSATAEDLPGLSFAGQQETYLNIHGFENVIEAVRRCWASLWTARAIGYRMKHEIDQTVVSLAVVVQELIVADAAGILFTANPITGARDESMITATWGLGESIVGGSVTPDTIRVNKQVGEVVQHEIAEKQVMTVRKENGTDEQPVPDNLRAIAVLTDEQAVELARLGEQVEALYGMPMDIEWTMENGKFAIVQARPITALPELSVEGSPDWTPPDPKGRFMRTSITEFLPDPLTPLFATLGVAEANAMMKRLVGYVTGVDGEVNFPDETIYTINGYAYLMASYTIRQWVFLLRRMLPKFPWMLRTGISHWKEEVLPRYIEVTRRWGGELLKDLSGAEILQGVHEVLVEIFEHLGALQAGTLGASAGSEMLLTKVYEKMVCEEGDPPAPTFVMGYNSIPIQAEKSLYDLALWCGERDSLSAYLQAASTQQIEKDLVGDIPADNVGAEDWLDFQKKLDTYQNKYGYLIFDMDFSKPLPMDNLSPVIGACKMYLAGQGVNPYERQSKLEEQRTEAVEQITGRLKGLKKKIFLKVLKWAQTLAAVREDSIAEIGLGYPVIREMLLELGNRFVQAGAIAKVDDIFWLSAEEVRDGVEALEQGKPVENWSEVVRQNKAIWRAQRRLIPPPQIPFSKKYMGFNIEGLMAQSEDAHTEDCIKGLGASPGSVTGKAVVLAGPDNFDLMKPGDILVANMTTPAWTPLFAMAAGVVTDIGGPLSHGSIVAREYGIPAVLGTGVATRRIQTGQTITVDGSEGVVRLHNSQS